MEQSRIVEHFLDFLLRAAVIKKYLHFFSRNAEGFCNAE